ncbi:Fe-S oxidoreductase [Candidatus Thermokryptus mobilis]|uniref:Fe-S oxidoreductase n=1 Tax=Candidatus Thermokryptus mobilis TaxID=1643428 RepID=A0A0S4NA26_9BACT|nr:heterodisulfide reductase-related iron-sulfur binding cluster [Candidatus Thermokryptus mobilis]CUU08108.1 Fe-S oxidoreductase [Candidatus Thermokryptus mobilis]
MSLQNLIFLIIFALSISTFLFNARRLLTYLKIGKPEDRFDNPTERLKRVFTIAFGQKKLLREFVAGWMHFFIFWGFVILLTAILDAILEGLFSVNLSVIGGFYRYIAFFQDLMGLLVILSIIIALYRRYIQRPKRLQVEKTSKIDATVILLLIFFIMLTMFGTYATQINLGDAEYYDLRFVSLEFAKIFDGFGWDAQSSLHSIFWWVHILLVLGFLNYLPFSKHLHIITSIPNVYLSSLKPQGRLNPISFENIENVEKFGALDVDDLTWKQIFDGYTCTECGRCTAACPANITGKPLSPREIIVSIRKRAFEKAPILLNLKPQNEDVLGKTLLFNYITEDELWACTTCMACVQECPVMIEHVQTIIDMRRYLVLTESKFPSELSITFRNLENNFTPWAFSHSTRGDWAQGLDIKTLAEDSNVEYLLWVGCAGSFDARYKKVAISVAKLLKIAGVSFGILGNEEKCTGDPARRAGNEYLAQMLIQENIQTFSKYNVKKIITICPHCFNTLKNEYPDFGGNYEVYHHVQFLEKLLIEGRLKISKKLDAKITYHDSCYLGRYNEIYDAPRDILGSINGVKLLEMKRSRDRGLCCGAGGARMFMEEKIGKRINIERTEEALSLNPDMIASACPFCMTMLTDGVKAKDVIDKVSVKDVAEILLEVVEGGETVA